MREVWNLIKYMGQGAIGVSVLLFLLGLTVGNVGDALQGVYLAWTSGSILLIVGMPLFVLGWCVAVFGPITLVLFILFWLCNGFRNGDWNPASIVSWDNAGRL